MTFGDLDSPVTTDHIKGIGAIAAKAILDERTLGKAMQLYHNHLSQREMIALLQSNWPDRQFPISHNSTESILHDMKHGSDMVSVKAGIETDRKVLKLTTFVTFQGTSQISTNPTH
jgi:hypothetical protein